MPDLAVFLCDEFAFAARNFCEGALSFAPQFPTQKSAQEPTLQKPVVCSSPVVEQSDTVFCRPAVVFSAASSWTLQGEAEECASRDIFAVGESAVGGGAERDLSSFMLSSFSLITFQEQKENIDDFEDNFGSVEISPFLVEEESQGKDSSQSREGDRALQALVQDFREAQSVNGKRSSCRKEGSAAKPAACNSWLCVRSSNGL